MSLLFTNLPDLAAEDRTVIASAYEKACDSLAKTYCFTPEKLGTIIDSMMDDLISLHRAGQRDEEKLALFAATQALKKHANA